jgi:hypothetical protein
MTLLLTLDRQRLDAVREAFRLRQLATRDRRLGEYYSEHNLFDEVERCRLSMLDHLRQACLQWRLTLCAQA